MKKSRKLLCVLLALVMVVSLLPVMAFAADEDVAAEGTAATAVAETSPETEGVVTDVIKDLFAKLPNYLVVVKTSDGRVAAGAQVVIFNQNKQQVAKAVANYGVAIFSKQDHLNIYSVSATWTDPKTGINYKSVVGFDWTLGKMPDIDVVTVFPTIDMILNTTDHNAYMFGYPDSTFFGTSRNITRAEVAAIMNYLMKDQVKARYASKKAPNFSDVKEGDWYYSAVAMCYKATLVGGYSDGTFKPNQPITRAEFFTMIAKLYNVEANRPITGTIFSDLNGHWAEKYITLLQKLGIVGGYEDGTVRPNNNLTRAEAVTILNRVLGRRANTSSFSDASVANAMKTWSDNQDTSKYYYAEIQEATNSHDYTWDINITTSTKLGEIIKAIISNAKNPITERWTSIKK